MTQSANAVEDAQPGGVLEAYAGGTSEELPLRAYAGLAAVFCGLFGAALWLGSRRGRLPKATSWSDIALLGLATHRLSRVVTRDRVATPLRAPFTRYEGKGGAGEVRERSRGRGLQKALGELLTCQFCADPWVAAAFAVGLAARPRETRAIASVFTTVAVSDFAHQAYAYARRLSK